MDIHRSNIIIFALAKLDGSYSSTTVSLAKEFSKNNKVLYVNPPLTWKDAIFNSNFKSFKDKLKKSFSGSKTGSINDNLTAVYLPPVIPINFLGKGRIYNLLKTINEKIIFQSLLRIIKLYGFQNYIYINSFNPFFDHNKYLKPDLSLYYTVDNIAESAYINKHGVWLEPEMMSKSDITLATSLQLKKQNEKYSNTIYYLPNAANLEIFDRTKSFDKPEEFQNIKNEIILFTGHLDRRTDLALLELVLQKHTKKTVVIVGPVSLKAEDLQKLQTYKNIIFTGSKPIEQLPAYLKYSSCAIIPFKCNKLTAGIYPLKINEYLAMGTPVVSTRFSEDISGFESVISLAYNENEFCELIDFEITHNTDLKIEDRVNIALSNTWTNRVKQFWKIISNSSHTVS